MTEGGSGGTGRRPDEARHVVVCSGHMVDAPGRPEERFPPRKESAVRGAMADALDGWGVGPGDLALSGGARGADILFAELCRERGVPVRLCLALPWDQFLDASVRLPEGDWVERLEALRTDEAVELSFLREDGEQGEGGDASHVFERNNLRILRVALAAPRSGDLLGLLVWDQRPTGDGPGGTSHFQAILREADADVAIVDPTRIP